MLKRFISSIPHMTLLVIILGLIKQILYYRNFKFNIIPYLGVSEVGLLVSSDLFVVIPMLIIMGSLYTLLQEETPTVKQEMPDTENSMRKSKKKFLDRKITSSTLIVILLVLATAFNIAATLQKNYYNSLFLNGTAIFLVFCFLIVLLKQHVKKYITTGNIVTMVALTGFAIIGFTNRISNELEYVEKGQYSGTTIITNDSTYISSDSSYYIGKVEKFVFIYNKKDSSTFIVPIEFIKKMKVKENNIKR